MARSEACDIIVIGGGSAAFGAAVAARQAGAERVVMLEKASEAEYGGNARYSGTGFRFVHGGAREIREFVPDLDEGLFATMAELRAEEAFDYLRNVNSGHPGSITSIHAASANLAFEQLVLLVKQNPGGRELAREDIKSLLYLLIDVVIQFGVEAHERFIKEIWYEPERKRRIVEGER